MKTLTDIEFDVRLTIRKTYERLYLKAGVEKDSVTHSHLLSVIDATLFTEEERQENQELKLKHNEFPADQLKYPVFLLNLTTSAQAKQKASDIQLALARAKAHFNQDEQKVAGEKPRDQALSILNFEVPNKEKPNESHPSIMSQLCAKHNPFYTSQGKLDIDAAIDEAYPQPHRSPSQTLSGE